MPNEIINCDCLSDIYELIQNNNIIELRTLLKELSLPKIEDDNYISFMGCKFNVMLLIYPESKPNEIISGFHILNQYLPIETCTNSLFVRTLGSLLNQYRNKIEIPNDMIVDNLIEPEIMEILRFCYWVDKCNNIMDKKNVK